MSDSGELCLPSVQMVHAAPAAHVRTIKMMSLMVLAVGRVQTRQSVMYVLKTILFTRWLCLRRRLRHHQSPQTKKGTTLRVDSGCQSNKLIRGLLIAARDTISVPTRVLEDTANTYIKSMGVDQRLLYDAYVMKALYSTRNDGNFANSSAVALGCTTPIALEWSKQL